MAPEEKDDAPESKPPPKRRTTRTTKKAAEEKAEPQTPEEKAPPRTGPREEHEVIHGAPSAPDLDAIALPEHPDDVSRAPRVDAMGQDKRRQVVGKSYGPTAARQAAVYLTVVAVLVVLFIGGSIAVGKLDEAPKDNAAEAPWARPDSPQTPPRLPE